MLHRPGKVDITKDEFKTIAKNLKNEEFQELLGDYMLEVSDPANKDEYDQYLQQMKKEGELPAVRIPFQRGFNSLGNGASGTKSWILYQVYHSQQEG